MPFSRLLETATDVAELPDPGALSGDEVTAAIGMLGELRRLTDSAMVELAAELARRCESGVVDTSERCWGYAHLEDLIAAEAGIDRNEAWAMTRVGTATQDRTALTGEILPPARPVLAEAVRAGRVSVAASDRIARTLKDAAEHVDADRLLEFERTLVEIAPHATTRELRALCRRVIDLADPDGAEPRDDLLRRRARVSIQQQDDGLTRITALLDPESAAFVIAALDARTAPRRRPTFAADLGDQPIADPSIEPWRTLEDRRVEALVGIAREALAHDDGHVAGAPVTVMVTVGLDELISGIGTARISGVDEPISAAAARRLASDAGVIPAVLGSDSELLDQGRLQRVATPGQRRALDLRDRGCAFPHCSAPPGWCEVAHILAWCLGGPTDLRNLILLCPFHHRLFDSGGWDLRWKSGVPWFIPPPHLDASRTPRRGGRLALAA